MYFARLVRVFLGMVFLLLVLGCLHHPKDSPLSGEKPPPELPAGEAAQVCLKLSDAMKKSGKEKEAIILLEKARQHDAGIPDASRKLAVLYDRQGMHQQALKEFEAALKQNPDDSDLLNDVGYYYYGRGNWSEAEKYLQKATKVNPKHQHAWINLGMTLGQQGRYQESFDAFVKVVTPGAAHANLGFILTTQGKREEARSAYQKALSIQPDLSLARAALAKLDKPADTSGSSEIQPAAQFEMPPSQPSALSQQ